MFNNSLNQGWRMRSHRWRYEEVQGGSVRRRGTFYLAGAR